MSCYDDDDDSNDDDDNNDDDNDDDYDDDVYFNKLHREVLQNQFSTPLHVDQPRKHKYRK
jgi:hypothetical protein